MFRTFRGIQLEFFTFFHVPLKDDKDVDMQLSWLNAENIYR